MIKNRFFGIIITSVFVLWLLFFFGWHYKVMASDLIEEAEEIVDSENGRLSSLEEDQEVSNQLLQDNIGYVAEINEDQDTNNYQENNSYDQEGDILSDDQTENEADMTSNDDQFRIMIIFCFGLTVGVITGKVLLGFF